MLFSDFFGRQCELVIRDSNLEIQFTDAPYQPIDMAHYKTLLSSVGIETTLFVSQSQLSSIFHRAATLQIPTDRSILKSIAEKLKKHNDMMQLEFLLAVMNVNYNGLFSPPPSSACTYVF